MTMKTPQRRRHKGRTDGLSYFALPHAVMSSPNWRAMPPRAIKLVCDLCNQYRPGKNGDLTAAWSVMQPLGWKSRETLAAAIADALRFGMIQKTRQGGLHACSLYALTWLSIDECDGKLEVAPTRIASSLWRQPKEPSKNASPSTDFRTRKHEIRAYDHKAA